MMTAPNSRGRFSTEEDDKRSVGHRGSGAVL